MKVVVPMRHGLGDCLHRTFIHEHGIKLFNWLYEEYGLGNIEEIILVYEEFMNTSIPELFQDFPFPIKCISTKNFEGVEEMGNNNHMPNVIGEYINGFTQIDVSGVTDSSSLSDYICDKPNYNLPEKYIVIHPYAGEDERYIKQQETINMIREVTDLPIVKIGKKISRNGFIESSVDCDIDLTNKLNLRESFYVIERAELVFSSLSYLRCFSSIFGQRVFEILENADKKIPCVLRTKDEYDQGMYNINTKNQWFALPRQNDFFRQEIRRLLDES
jgi:hypothetical protein